MGRYVSVSTATWHIPDFRGLSLEEKVVYLYLREGPMQNILGCYVLSLAALAEEVCLSRRSILRILARLSEQKFVIFDSQSRVIFIRGHFTANPLKNANCAKSGLKMLQELPASPVLTAVAGELVQQRMVHLRELIYALQDRAGVWLPGHEPLVTPPPQAVQLPQQLREQSAKQLPELFQEHIPQLSGEQLGESVTVTVTVTDTVESRDAVQPINPLPAAAAYPLLSRVALVEEVARSNTHPLVHTDYPAATLAAAEANLRALQAAAGDEDLEEVLLRLRRTSNLADLQRASCPAVIVGRVAEWALRDWRANHGHEEVSDDGGDNSRGAALLRRSRATMQTHHGAADAG